MNNMLPSVKTAHEEAAVIADIKKQAEEDEPAKKRAK